MVQPVEWAESVARDRLAEVLARRWAHVQNVADQAGKLSSRLGEDAELLLAAVWLHDVVYAPEPGGDGLPSA
ncbi:HD domain-containing protein [Pseudonocardia artemisiae]|uniref:HD domain-containing protein n=1 Tax=Pseudonocardia bannensis TaxID=630973 RepID=UPI0028B1FBAA|nr:HD domain-containing protein [Pseudonocardia bannensis]